MGWAVGLCACASAVRLAPPCARYAPPRMSQGAGATPAQKSAFGAESSRVAPGSSVLLVGALIKRRRHQTNDAAWSVDDSLDELGRLCDTALLEPLGRLVQTMQSPSPSTFIGSGKLDELSQLVKARRAGAVVFDDELSPAQQRNLEEAVGVPVIDRTALILQIFESRARTREAKLQVNLAQMRYMLPRLQTFLDVGAGLDAKGGSGGGGQYLKGAGETQQETDRRLFRKQIGRLEKEIEAVRAQRGLYRQQRGANERLPVVAIVGYTNAGKSTLLNALCGEDAVYADDLLFATLDPTTRRLRLPGGRDVLLSDTVGFVQKLPTKLVASFRATLEELQDAAVVVHLVDCSSPQARHAGVARPGLAAAASSVMCNLRRGSTYGRCSRSSTRRSSTRSRRHRPTRRRHSPRRSCSCSTRLTPSHPRRAPRSHRPPRGPTSTSSSARPRPCSQSLRARAAVSPICSPRSRRRCSAAPSASRRCYRTRRAARSSRR